MLKVRHFNSHALWLSKKLFILIIVINICTMFMLGLARLFYIKKTVLLFKFNFPKNLLPMHVPQIFKLLPFLK